MSKTFEDFQRAFPKLYGAGVVCGFNPSPGWIELVWKLSEQLEPLGFRCDQVKSKFAGLRFYLGGLAGDDEGNPGDDPGAEERYERAHALIQAAENESERTCEDCGKPGQRWQISPSRWLWTLCPDCQQIHQERGR